MPIRGVSSRDSVDPRFKVIGKLKKGAPKQDGRVGLDLDYFRFDSNDPIVLKVFEDLYGPEPRNLDVYLPYRTMEENFSSWRELYGQNGLCKVRCDGENWVDWIEGPRHYHGEQPCTKKFKDPLNRCPGCSLQPVGRLSVILLELWKAGHIGLVTVETHSWNDIATLSAKLVQWEPLTGKLFTMWREDTRIGAPIKEKRAAVEKSLIYIELTNEYLIALLETSRRKALADVSLLKLPEPIEGEINLSEETDYDPGSYEAVADIEEETAEAETTAPANDDAEPQPAQVGRDPQELIGPATETQRDEIYLRLVALDPAANDKKIADEALQRQGFPKIDALTGAQALGVIERLRAKHWEHDKKSLARFWAVAGEKGFDAEQAYKILGVTSLEDFVHDLTSALQMLEKAAK